MINVTISPVPLAVLSLVNFALSWAWYSPALFAKPWMRALGIDANHEMTEAERKRMPFLFLSGIVSSVVFVSALMILINALRVTTFFSGMLTGFVLWAGFALTHSLNTLWEGRKVMVLAINNGLFAVTYVVFGGILAIWK